MLDVDREGNRAVRRHFLRGLELFEVRLFLGFGLLCGRGPEGTGDQRRSYERIEYPSFHSQCSLASSARSLPSLFARGGRPDSRDSHLRRNRFLPAGLAPLAIGAMLQPSFFHSTHLAIRNPTSGRGSFP